MPGKTAMGQGAKPMTSIYQAETEQDRALVRELFLEYLEWANRHLNREYGIDFNIQRMVERDMAEVYFLPLTQDNAGKYLALAHIGHALILFIGIALFVNLFLGGAANVVTFLAKMLVVFVAGLCINAVFPRFRIEQAVKYLWKWPTLLAFLGLIISSAVRS